MNGLIGLIGLLILKNLQKYFNFDIIEEVISKCAVITSLVSLVIKLVDFIIVIQVVFVVCFVKNYLV